MITEIEGIILNEMPYGETSKIINVLTKDKGIVGIMCKGAKSLKSNLRAVTMVFTYAKFFIYYKENKLSILKDVDVINSFINIRQDIMLIAYVNYLVELTHQVAKQAFDAKIYDILMESLLKIENGLDPLIITNIVEIKYLDFLGISLNLDECVLCGNKTNILTLDGDAGGYICSNCHTNEKIVSPKTIKLLRMYYYVDIKNITKISIDEHAKLETNYFLNRYYDRYTGLYLKSKKFIENLNNL